EARAARDGLRARARDRAGGPRPDRRELRALRHRHACCLAERPDSTGGRAMSLLHPLTPEDANVIVVVMLTPSQALDLFIGDLTRKTRSKSDRTAHSYRPVLSKFVEQLET